MKTNDICPTLTDYVEKLVDDRKLGPKRKRGELALAASALPAGYGAFLDGWIALRDKPWTGVRT